MTSPDQSTSPSPPEAMPGEDKTYLIDAVSIIAFERTKTGDPDAKHSFYLRCKFCGGTDEFREHYKSARSKVVHADECTFLKLKTALLPRCEARGETIELEASIKAILTPAIDVRAPYARQMVNALLDLIIARSLSPAADVTAQSHPTKSPNGARSLSPAPAESGEPVRTPGGWEERQVAERLREALRHQGNTEILEGRARDALTALDSFLYTRPAEGGEWKPIETAPKDGLEILTFAPEAGTAIGYYGIDQLDSGAEYGTWRDDGATPTHWMPLPRPPLPSVPQQERK